MIRFRTALAGMSLSLASLLAATSAQAHPHVFIDGGVDFRIGEGRMLEALNVTWLYDEFETLYMLAANKIPLNDQGGLDEVDRITLVKRLSNWPEDFDGSAHLSLDGAEIALNWPENLDAHLIDGRLKMTFSRRLSDPIALSTEPFEVGFFESTYFFDFTVTQIPQIIGVAENCSAQVIPFDPATGDQAVLDALAKLDREETPDLANVGATFADRIILQCA